MEISAESFAKGRADLTFWKEYFGCNLDAEAEWVKGSRERGYCKGVGGGGWGRLREAEGGWRRELGGRRTDGCGPMLQVELTGLTGFYHICISVCLFASVKGYWFCCQKHKIEKLCLFTDYVMVGKYFLKKNGTVNSNILFSWKHWIQLPEFLIANYVSWDYHYFLSFQSSVSLGWDQVTVNFHLN